MNTESLLQWYENEWQTNRSKAMPSWLKSLQKQTFETFLLQGFPTKRDEDWKYTDLSTVGDFRFKLALEKTTQMSHHGIQDFYLPQSNRLVFVDGIFSAELSHIMELPQGAIVSNLATAWQNHGSLVSKHCIQEEDSTALINLNTACMNDGVFIFLPKDCVVEKPIHILHVTTAHSDQIFHNPRHLVITEQAAQLTLFEDYQSLQSNRNFTNAHTQLFVGACSNVNYLTLQNQSTTSIHLAHTNIYFGKDSHVNVHRYSLGGQLSRENIHCFLRETGASCQLNGLYLPIEQQHIDIHTYLHHLAPVTSSVESYKGIIGKKSRAVFNGKIIVAEKAQKIQADLQNKNLLLSMQSEVNTKPELEIYADDVKCTHGATVGQLDQEMLFYLRSRGIPVQEAHQLLLLAFLSEHLSSINDADIAHKIRSTVMYSCREEVVYE